MIVRGWKSKLRILLASVLFASQAAHAQFSAAEMSDFQSLLESDTANPVRDCTDAGLRKLYIYRAFQVTKKSDAAVEQEQSLDTQDEPVRAQLQREIDLWAQTHLPDAVAQNKLEACLREAFVPTSAAAGRLHRHCLGNAQFSIDVMQAKHVKRPVHELKASLRRARLPIAPGQADAFVDEMFAAGTPEQEIGLARELYSSCMNANNGRFLNPP